MVDSSTNDGMRDLIAMVNKMQDAYSQLGAQVPIDLPQIAVVGGQSAGKSSVLENFVGKDFLPRGSGIVTRRPLILQLNYNPNNEWGEFLHAPGKKFTDFGEIRAEIEAETERMTGQNKGISNVPINLRVHSPEVLDLTLIDLPGLTKVAVGDQPKDIENQIYNMIFEFICRENCIILAVTPANQDLANSDALKLAKEVDPDGLRTIGVLTKLDLMDAGTDAREILENKTLPLRRGYVGVINRSQADINGNKDIRAALDAERRFFMSREEYRHMADRMGTKYLQVKLNQQLINHIREKLPQLKQNLQKQVNAMEKEVKAAQSELSDPSKNQTKNLVKMVNSIGSEIEESIEGSKDNPNLTKLSGGARIAKVFNERFPYELARMELDERQLRQEISFAIRNVNGIRGVFTPDEAFEGITKRLIEKLKPACVRCCDMVSEELHDLVGDICRKLQKYPRFQEEVMRIINDYLMSAENKTKEQIDMAVNFELAYINSNHPDFIGFSNASSAKTGKKKKRVKSADGIIRKGWLSHVTSGTLYGSKTTKHWFVLTEDAMFCFKDDTEKEKKFAFRTLELKTEEVNKPGSIPGTVFRIFSESGDKLHKDVEELILTATSKENKEAWQASLLMAGITPVNAENDSVTDEEVHENPELAIQTQKIRNLVDSYMEIVVKKFQDQLPKVCMCLMVNQMKEFAKDELLATIYRDIQDVDSLLAESDDSRRQREELLHLYTASKEALKAITDVTMRTKSEPVPPPVENSIVVDPKPRTVSTTEPATPPRSLSGGRAPMVQPASRSSGPPSKAPSKPPTRQAPPARAPPPQRPTRPAAPKQNEGSF
eukprot:m.189725 g.189725  ORF g.189725 m.189725 type:complete len:832 (-) comp15632_c0_seq13:173-2668(-)